jgi:hypothetical protein
MILSHVAGTGTTGSFTIIAGTAGQSIAIFGLALTGEFGTVGTPTAALQDTSGGALSQTFQVSGPVNLLLPMSLLSPYWVAPLGLGVQIVQSGTITIGYDVWYTKGSMMIPVGTPFAST